jgi:eukaryotic-like serine/threonine-protein kinase
MEAAESVLRAGYRLDRYELLCPIASGGMATVWLARLRGKRGFEKLFAIKTIRTELVEDQRFQEMFLDEARIASGIQHPHVAQILDLGEQADVLFIVMEWVDGDSLAKIRRIVAKRGGRIPVGLSLRVIADACAGLHAAHELRDERGEPLGIVHRDVSPQNILVGSSGSAKVIDFGIAKAQNRQQGQTRTGVVKGKVQYMAPEQVNKGRIVDRRADIWALGICLHELVTGQLPNDGEDDVEVIRRLMGDQPPKLAEGVPEPIVRVLAKSLAIDPDARFPTAAGMQRALEGAMKELGEAATSEDVASFLRTEMADLVEKRKQLVGKAIDDARERGTPVSESKEDVAFATTEVSERAGLARPPTDGAKAIALVRRKGPGSPTSSPGLPWESPSQQSHLTASGGLEHDPIEIPKRSRAALWVFLLVVAGATGAALYWPGLAGRVLAIVMGGSAGDARVLVPVAPPSSGVASPGPAEGPPATGREPAFGKAPALGGAVVAASASSGASAPSMGGASAHGAPPEPSGPHGLHGATPPQPPALIEPVASGRARTEPPLQPLPRPQESAPPPPGPAPATPGDEPTSNPYSN